MPQDELSSAFTSFEIVPGVRCAVQSDRYIIVLDSNLVFSSNNHGTIHTSNLRQLMFELEECIPVDADAMSIVTSNRSNCGLNMVVDGASIANAIDGDPRLKNKICLAVIPRALLILQALFQSEVHADILVAIMQDRTATVDCIRIQAKRLTDWRWMSADISKVTEWLSNSTCGEALLQQAMLIRDGELGDRNINEWAICGTVAMQDAVDFEAAQSLRILKGLDCASFSFTNGPLRFVNHHTPAVRSATIFASLTVLGLLVIGCSILWRAKRYQAIADQEVAYHEQMFSELFPGEPLPIGVMGRIESEHRRLLGTKDSDSIPKIGSCLPPIKAFLQSMPEDARFNVSLLHFVPIGVHRVEGSAKTFGDLEAVRVALAAGGFDLPEFSTRSTPYGVSMLWEDLIWKRGGQGQTAETVAENTP